MSNPDDEEKMQKVPPKGFRFQNKKGYLTYSCPKNGIQPLTKGEIHKYFTEKYGANLSVLVISEETHKNKTVHFHVFVEFYIRVRETNPFVIMGIHPNNRARTDGKTEYSKHDWLEYLTKEDSDRLEHGIDVELFLAITKKKGASKIALVANQIYDDKITSKELRADPKLRSIMLMHGPKIEQFRVEVEMDLQQMVVLKRYSDDFINKMLDQFGPSHANFCQWWNFRLVEGHFQKCHAIAYLHAKKRGVQKSTLLKIVCLLANGNTSIQWDWHDKGWQEKCTKNMRVLGMDALQTGKQISLSLLEKLGDNSQITCKQRNCKGGNQFKGPVIITSNVTIEELKPEDSMTWNSDILIDRCLYMNFDKYPAGALCDELCRLHALDPKMFMDSKKMKVYGNPRNPFKMKKCPKKFPYFFGL